MGAVSVSRADTAGVTATDAPQPVGTVIVRISEAASPLPLERLVEALRSQLAELRVDVELRSDALASHSTQSGAVVAVVWLERSGEALVVRFYEPAGSNLRERTIPVSGTDAASIEEVALVVRSAVSALLERSASAAPSLVAPTAPTPQLAAETPRASDAARTSSASPSNSQSFEVSGAYVLTRYARATDWQHGAAFGIEWREPQLPLAAGFAYTWLPPLETSTADLLVTLRRHPFEAFLGVPWQAEGGPFRVEPGVALIADPITRTSSALSGELETTPTTTLWSWAASARLRVGARPLPGVWLFGAACADVLLSRYEHVTEGPGGAVLLSPLPVRPRFQLGGAAEF
jgi:hypothetical protein